jgi:hypothetical protein
MKSKVSPELRRKFAAAWMKKGMVMLYHAKALGLDDETCLNIDHLDFWIGMQEMETTTPETAEQRS